MSLTKTVDGMRYEAAGKKDISDPKAIDRKAYARNVEKHNSAYTLWLLACKHRVGLLTTGNIILVLNWAIPEWPTIIRSMF